MKLLAVCLLAAATAHADTIIGNSNVIFSSWVDVSRFGNDPARWPTSVTWTVHSSILEAIYNPLFHADLLVTGNIPVVDLGEAYLRPVAASADDLTVIPDEPLASMLVGPVTVLTPAQQLALFTASGGSLDATVSTVNDWPFLIDIARPPSGAPPLQILFSGTPVDVSEPADFGIAGLGLATFAISAATWTSPCTKPHHIAAHERESL